MGKILGYVFDFGLIVALLWYVYGFGKTSGIDEGALQGYVLGQNSIIRDMYDACRDTLLQVRGW